MVCYIFSLVKEPNMIHVNTDLDGVPVRGSKRGSRSIAVIMTKIQVCGEG